jgi:predicted Zn-dependent protease
MASLPPADFISVLKHLNAATGYLGLGMHMEAWNELEEIGPDKRALPEVLNVRIEVCRALEKWEMMAEIAQHLGKLEPDEAEHPINLAFAVRRFKDTQAAAKILEEAKNRFPQEATIPYNLACYRAVAGNVGEARQLLAEAFTLDASLRLTALDDQDLVGVWDSI